MSLLTEVQLRYDAQRLKELTNVRNRAAVAVDSTKLQQACDSASAWFRIYAQAELDLTDVTHVELACDGVIACLQKWGGASAGVKKIRWDEWKEALDDLSKRGARGHIGPLTSSVLEPTPPDTSRGPVRPAFDDPYFDKMTPTRQGGTPDPDSRS